MPEVSRFYGIIIRFYYRDHPPAHFHALYGGHEAIVDIESGAILRGYLPNTAVALIDTWRSERLTELREDWDRARQTRPLLPISPLE